MNFTGGLAPGGTAYFSLEEPLSPGTFTVRQVPEPPLWVLLGFGVAALTPCGVGYKVAISLCGFAVFQERLERGRFVFKELGQIGENLDSFAAQMMFNALDVPLLRLLV